MSSTEHLIDTIRELKKLLRVHHDWHLQAGTVGLKDHDGSWIEIDNAAEYSDSSLYERTEKALEDAPLDWEPMPRGGVRTWWWREWVLAVRARKVIAPAVGVVAVHA